jgi:hypothetical protein
MKITHPDGSHEIVMVAGSQLLGEVYSKSNDALPGWVSIGYIASEGGLNIDGAYWDSFMALVKEIDEARK